MNRRIDKKIHKRYLADILVESTQDEFLINELENMEINQTIELKIGILPKGFKKLKPDAAKYKLSYCEKRINYSSVPKTDSSWWI